MCQSCSPHLQRLSHLISKYRYYICTHFTDNKIEAKAFAYSYMMTKWHLKPSQCAQETESHSGDRHPGHEKYKVILEASSSAVPIKHFKFTLLSQSILTPHLPACSPSQPRSLLCCSEIHAQDCPGLCSSAPLQVFTGLWDAPSSLLFTVGAPTVSELR